MLIPAVLLLSLLLAASFGAIASREISRAGRAEQDTAARHRFLAAFDQRGGAERVPAELLVQTFETIAGGSAARRPALRPTARLARDLGMTVADVEDAALLVAARCEGQLPHGCDLDALAHQVRTVEDFVRFLAPFVEGQAPHAAHAA